ncbi:MAG TPA: ribosomal protein S18-alanine N-acetyltransferase [Thermaerobacter sp.]
MALSHDVRSQPAEIRIEPMTPGDLPGVLAIERRSFPTPWSERAFVSELRDNLYADYIVARHDGRVVGYAGMWCILDEAHVTTIAVDPEFRGRGVGDRLLTALEERALRYGCRRMTLEVRVSNHVAQRLYRRHGFRPCGIRRGYYVDNGEDAIVMWRDRLDPPGPVVADEPGAAGGRDPAADGPEATGGTPSGGGDSASASPSGASGAAGGSEAT